MEYQVPKPRIAVAIIAFTLLITGCSIPGSGGSPSPTVTSDAAPMLVPGTAEKAVAKILAATNQTLALQVVITARTATASVLIDGKVHTWQIDSGSPREVETDVTYVDQALFDPKSFDFYDVAHLFRRATDASGSASDQRLEIVDYNAGQVLMTVTSRPESFPVFFFEDGTQLPRLDLTKAQDMQVALEAVSKDAPYATLVGLNEQGFYLETRGPKDSTIRMLRPENLPVWKSSRKSASELATFPVAKVRPDVIESWFIKLGAPDKKVSVEIDTRDSPTNPSMRFSNGSDTVVTDLDGKEITDQVAA
ncbi:MAG: hypothetical protein CSA63_02090 [Propionibacterium sp.]|nr:MAG: hypothetical protein CSA63_02090 [Propionibacterium sp.]